MKLKLLYLFLIACPLSGFAQEYYEYNVSDKFGFDGRRLVTSETKKFVIGEDNYDVYVKAFASTNDTVYYLGLSSYSFIPEDAEVLFKTKEGQILHLLGDSVSVEKVTLPAETSGLAFSNGGIFTQYATTTPPKDVDYYSSLFRLSKQDMEMLKGNRIKKIRIANGRNYAEKEYKGNTLGRWLKDCIRSVQAVLENEPKKKIEDIYDGF